LHLGPLSWAETRKFIWRCGLDSLDPSQEQLVGRSIRPVQVLDDQEHRRLLAEPPEQAE